MANALDELYTLRDETSDYLKLRWASLRLGVVDSLSQGAAKALGVVVAAILVIIALGFLAIALALWVGQTLANPALGFLIVGGGFLLTGIIFWIFGRHMFLNTMVSHFVDMFFTDYDYRHGTQK